MAFIILTLWGCGGDSTPTTTGSTTTAANATAGANAGSAGAMLPIADKCPQLPAAQGFRFSSCCQPDNTCGIDASSLNRGCMSYAAFRMYFNFVSPAPTTCDGAPIPSGSSAAGAGATQ